MNLSVSEGLLYGGIAAMATAVVIVAAGIVIFTLTGIKLKKKAGGRIRQAFGEPKAVKRQHI